MRIIRIFPRRTSATPTDDLAVIDRLPGFFDVADRVQISVTFTWDRKRAEYLEREWRHVAPTEIGGPAYDDRGGEFIPGRYLRDGYVITSRGCPNRCWFCSAWRREGRSVRTLPIRDGCNVLDNNLLACPDDHIRAVFAMLRRQRHRPRFTGGLEPARLQPWHVEQIEPLHPKVVWLAYDTPDDYEPLRDAAGLFRAAGMLTTAHVVGCYVLIGYRGDTIAEAEARLRQVVELGIMPQAMLFDGGAHVPAADVKTWKRFAREWANRVIVGHKMLEAHP